MSSNGYKCPHLSEKDPILKILDKYQDHPSIKLTKAKNNSFKFLIFVKLTLKKTKNLSKALNQ